MRVVMLGKGGSGKSTLAGLLCAELSDRGRNVVAIDADSVPGLAQVLGVPPTDDWFLAGMAVREGGGWRLDGTPDDIVRRCAREGPGMVRFLQVGNVDSSLKDFEFRRESFPGMWSGTMAFNTVVRIFDDEEGWVVVDLQGGTVQAAGGLVGTTGVALVVVEPFAKSLFTARRLAEMGKWPAGMQLAAVANKVASPDDEAYVGDELARLGIPLWASIPVDPAIMRAERAASPIATLDQRGPAKAAIAGLADRLDEVAARRERAPSASHT